MNDGIVVIAQKVKFGFGCGLFRRQRQHSCCTAKLSLHSIPVDNKLVCCSVGLIDSDGGGGTSFGEMRDSFCEGKEREHFKESVRGGLRGRNDQKIGQEFVSAGGVGAKATKKAVVKTRAMVRTAGRRQEDE